MVTISDIARAAGVSPATVTRVLNGKGYVSDEKRDAVLRTAKKLHYIPNHLAGSLRRKRSTFIGLVLAELSENQFFARFSGAFDRAAQDAGYQVLTVVTNSEAGRERQLVESLVSLMVEAVVFLGATVGGAQTVEIVQSRGIPVVMIERPSKVSGIDSVLIDNLKATRMATEHILQRGHRRIGYIGRRNEDDVEIQRLRGFTETLGEHGVALPEGYVRNMPDYTLLCGRAALFDMLECGEPPTAVLIASDLLACGALQEAYARGLRVPDDLSLVGFDNTLSALCSPALTSVELQPDQIGMAAVDMVIERKRKDRAGAKTVLLGAVLIERGSVKQL